MGDSAHLVEFSMALLQSWRWYGPNDTVSLNDIEQAGATGIVHALHHVPVGEVWEVKDIQARQQLIEEKEENETERNLKWVVVESLNVHESIKKGLGERDELIEKYIISLKNLAKSGIKIVCYNFMPVLDWTRTSLDFRYKDGSKALRFDSIALAAFDLCILNRKKAESDYSESMIDEAKSLFETLSHNDIELLTNNILQGVPGSGGVLSIYEFKTYLDSYRGISKIELRSNLDYFLQRVIPEAEKIGIKLCCHPDDPPFDIFGLPRIVSTEEDLNLLVNSIKSPSNGITICTGSLGPNPENNITKIIDRFGKNIHFIHLRNIQREGNGSFHESDHLDGSVDMHSVMEALVKESIRREGEGREDFQIPFRPDHGHQMLDDLDKEILFHGYSAIGRLRGLAELRGLELGIRKSIEIGCN